MTLPLLAGLLVGAISGFWVGAAVVQARMLWPHRPGPPAPPG